METTFFQNWDLLVLGIVIIVTPVLGFIVYFENTRSSMRKSFLGFAITTSLWGIFNYLSYHVQPASSAFILLKLAVFTVTWQTYYFLKFSVVFPREEKFSLPRFWWILQVVICLVSFLTLTPLVFEKIGSVASNGSIAQVVNGPAIPLFGTVNVGLTIASVLLLLRKTFGRRSVAGESYLPISAGVVMMFVLIITTNFILPTFLDNPEYIQFGALFVFPFIALTSFAIIKNKVFNVKVVSTELFITTLLVLSLFQLVRSRSLSEIILGTGILVSLLAVGILLIRSVLKEIEQREELQRLTEELKAKNVQLDELSHFKTQLLSLASHQVKSPLAAMKGFVSLILDGTYGEVSEKVKEILGKVKKSADGLIGLINTLLDVRKVEEGKMDYQFAPTDIVEMVRGVFEELKPLAGQNKLEFTLTAPAEKIMINADATKLKQVIQNITDNAIKYTPPVSVESPVSASSPQADSPQAATEKTGFVKVAIEKKENKVVVSVQDSGVGIPADLVPHLFEEFVRDEKVKKKILGTGLGLYIARKIVEAHGGRLWAESDGEGKGSRFYVELKLI